ncbi:MAG: Peroxisomal membrane protein PAS20 [Candelina mexicana]|nr:MAG: Peroxisomal membrane protein PAS20 [Candelina mexicana]
MVIAQPFRTAKKTNQVHQQLPPKSPKRTCKPGSLGSNTRSLSARSSQASTKSQTSTLKRLRRRTHFSACAKGAVAIGTLAVGLVTLTVYNYRSDRLARWTAYKDFREACQNDKTDSKEITLDCQLALSKPLPTPPYMPVEFFTRVVKRAVSLIPQTADPRNVEAPVVRIGSSATNNTKCMTIETSSARACLAVKTAVLLAMIMLVALCLAALYWLSRFVTAVPNGLARTPMLAVPPFRAKRPKSEEGDCSVRSAPLVAAPLSSSVEVHSELRFRGSKQENVNTVLDNGTTWQNPLCVNYKALGICRVLHDFSPQPSAEDQKLIVKKGELVTGLEKITSPGDSFEWWHCETHDGRLGYLPRFILKSDLDDHLSFDSDIGDRADALLGDPVYDSGIETEDSVLSTEVESARSIKTTINSLSATEQEAIKVPDKWPRRASSTYVKPTRHSAYPKPSISSDAASQMHDPNQNRFTKWLIKKIPSPHTKVKSGSAILGLAQTGAVAAATAGGKAGQEKALEVANQCLDVAMPQIPQDQMLSSVASNAEMA